jgi:hypothetical protein
MTEAKRLVRRRLETPPGFMELAGAGIERLPKPVITYIALKEPKL